jgi:hypothetical protein
MPIFMIEIRFALLLAFLAFLLWLVSRKVRTHSELMKLHLEGRNRMLDRFGDAEAFLSFARTEEGRAFLETSSLAAPARTRPGVRLLQCGLISLLLGFGMRSMGIGWRMQANLARGSFLDTNLLSNGQSFETFGTLLLFGGAGLVLASAIAWFGRPR